MIPKGSGSENNSFLKMAISAEGIDAIKTFVIDCVLAAGGKTCPPTIVGVGLGGTSDLASRWPSARRRASSAPAAPTPRRRARNAALGRGRPVRRRPAGSRRRLDPFAVHIELAATHITMNPIAVNMQCHSARRARATSRRPA